MESDGDLLRRYVEHHSDTAFTVLVERHINLVYRAALRRVGGNAHAADDVSQRVFTALARKAPGLKQHESIAGWLYVCARFAAAEVVRAEQRRRRHEQEAHAMNELNAPTAIVGTDAEHLLDDIMDRLPARDREVVTLHFLEGRSFPEIAAMLSSTADATRMRVNRAMDRMREDLARCGITSSAAALGATLTAQSTMAAPSGLATTIAQTALHNAGGAAGPLKLLSLAKSVPTIVTAGMVLLITGVGVFAYVTRRPAALPPAPAPETAVAPAAIPRTPLSGTPSGPSAVGGRAAVPPSPISTGGESGWAPFSELSAPERIILARLWNEQQTMPPAGRARWGLKVPETASNYPGVALLLARGWVGFAEPKHVLHLTPAGRGYCSKHSEEILGYSERPQRPVQPIN